MKKLKKNSQAAMEFLMTHGWALLIVVIVVSVLAIFVFSYINKNKGVGCTFTPGLSYVDHTYAKGVLTILIKNGLDKDLDMKKIESTGCLPRWYYSNSFLQAGGNFKIVMGCANFKGDVTIHYKTREDNLDHINKGKCDAQTTSPADPTDEYFTNCSNANNFELCSGLVAPTIDFCRENYKLCPE
jgi:hypothetical protein